MPRTKGSVPKKPTSRRKPLTKDDFARLGAIGGKLSYARGLGYRWKRGDKAASDAGKKGGKMGGRGRKKRPIIGEVPE